LLLAPKLEPDRLDGLNATVLGPEWRCAGCARSGQCPETIWTGTQRGFSPEISVAGEVAAHNITEATPEEGTSIPIPIAYALSKTELRTAFRRFE